MALGVKSRVIQLCGDWVGAEMWVRQTQRATDYRQVRAIGGVGLNVGLIWGINGRVNKWWGENLGRTNRLGD